MVLLSQERYHELIDSKAIAKEIIETHQALQGSRWKQTFLVFLESANDDLSNQDGLILRERLAGFMYKNQEVNSLD